MKSLRLILVVGPLLLVLGGCGSSAPPPFTVSCVTQRLPSGAIRANVRVKTAAGHVGQAYIYGPPFDNVRHIFPIALLRPTHVTVQVGHSSQSYVGFLVRRVAPKKPTLLTLRFLPPPHSVSILVSAAPVVHASSWSVLQNPACVLHKRTVTATLLPTG